MNNNIKIGLYIMTSKGLGVLNAILNEFGPKKIAFIVSSHDKATAWDAFDEILVVAKANNIPFYLRNETPVEATQMIFAVSWRWMIFDSKARTIIFHDSLLPKYRGFSPLVNALINGEKVLGVTAIFAENEYDKGEIISQESMDVTYPMLIADAIKSLTYCYERLAVSILRKLEEGKLTSYPQNETEVTYSLWRDAEDYFINWDWDAEKICRFVNALGFPYLGSATRIDDEVYRINKVEIFKDVIIENRVPGKVIFVEGVCPIVVCGRGLIKIIEMTNNTTSRSALPIKKFRTKFH